jgi:hypothetical protein
VCVTVLISVSKMHRYMYISPERQCISLLGEAAYQSRKATYISVRRGYISVQKRLHISLFGKVAYQSKKGNKAAPRQCIVSSTVLVDNRRLYQQSFSVFYRSYSLV